jgi:hypothetical protein
LECGASEARSSFHNDDDHLPPINDRPEAGKDANHPSWVAGWLRPEYE